MSATRLDASLKKVNVRNILLMNPTSSIGDKDTLGSRSCSWLLDQNLNNKDLSNAGLS